MSHDWLTDRPFAHRGLHGPTTGHVENSLSAFQAAQECGHGFELDVLLSRDGKAMVFHDMTLLRLTEQHGRIQNHTAQQLSDIPLTGSHDTIPTLAHILSVDWKNPVLVEIKGDQGRPEQIAIAVYEAIRTYAGPIAIMSFYPEIIRWFQKNAPVIRRGLVATSTPDGEMPADFFSPEKQKYHMGNLSVDFMAYDIKALPNEATAHCRKKNIPLLTWTVRTKEQQQKATQYTDNIIYENLDL